MNQDKECSRCGYIVHTDKDQQNRMKRHVEGRHTKHKTISERDGTEIKGFTNLDIGPVKWITCWI